MNKKILSFVLFTLLLSSSIGLSFPNQEADNSILSGPMDSPWPMKCHDVRHTGRSPYSTADNYGDELWRFKTDSWIEGGPIIGEDGTIYFGAFDWYLYAVYPNGSLKWKYKTEGRIWSTPALAEDGTIYIGSYDDYLYAVYPDGTLKWKFPTHNSISTSPAIADDGTIYIGNMGSPKQFGCSIIAINPNGTKKWDYQTEYYIVSDPAIGNDGTIYIGSGDGYLYVMNPDGSLKWRFKTGDWVKSHPSIADDGTIYFDSFDGNLYALFPNGTLKWSISAGGSAAASVSIGKDGEIYDPGKNYLYAHYPNGTMKWQFYLGHPEAYIGHSSPAIDADGIIYIGTGIGTTSGGDIIAINPDGTERWRMRIANDWVESSPCIGKDGTVYIGSSSTISETGLSYGYLHAFGPVESNKPPIKPIITGELKGHIREDINYIFSSFDPDNNPVYFYIDWGDEEISDWIGPYASGEEKILRHTWTKQGTYDIRAKSKDTLGAESDWATLTVTMPRNYNLLSRFPLLEKIFWRIK